MKNYRVVTAIGIAIVAGAGLWIAGYSPHGRDDCAQRDGVLVRGAWFSLECVQPARKT